MEFIVEGGDREAVGDAELYSAVQETFVKYDMVNGSDGASFLPDVFAESFYFCGPAGQQMVGRADFMAVLPKMQSFYKSIGLVSNRLASVRVRKLDAEYLQAEGHWELRFRKLDASLSVVDISAACILSRAQGMKIVVQIDHQDLNKELGELGLLKPR